MVGGIRCAHPGEARTGGRQVSDKPAAIRAKDRKSLRAIETERDLTPMTVDEVLETGTEIAKELRLLILAALEDSTGIGARRGFKQPWTPSDLRAIRRQAQQSSDAWLKVAAAATEILDLEVRMTPMIPTLAELQADWIALDTGDDDE